MECNALKAGDDAEKSTREAEEEDRVAIEALLNLSMADKDDGGAGATAAAKKKKKKKKKANNKKKEGETPSTPAMHLLGERTLKPRCVKLKVALTPFVRPKH